MSRTIVINQDLADTSGELSSRILSLRSEASYSRDRIRGLRNQLQDGYGSKRPNRYDAKLWGYTFALRAVKHALSAYQNCRTERNRSKLLRVLRLVECQYQWANSMGFAPSILSSDVEDDRLEKFATRLIGVLEYKRNDVRDSRQAHRSAIAGHRSDWNRLQRQISDTLLEHSLHTYTHQPEDITVDLDELQSSLSKIQQVDSASVTHDENTNRIVINLDLDGIIMRPATDEDYRTAARVLYRKTGRSYDFDESPDDVDLFNIPLPPMTLKVTLPVRNISRNYTMELISPINCYGYSGGFQPHPHWINRLKPCLGSFEGTIYELLHTADIVSAMQCLIAFIGSYAPDDPAGAYFYEFFTVIVNQRDGYEYPVSNTGIWDDDILSIPNEDYDPEDENCEESEYRPPSNYDEYQDALEQHGYLESCAWYLINYPPGHLNYEGDENETIIAPVPPPTEAAPTVAVISDGILEILDINVDSTEEIEDECAA